MSELQQSLETVSRDTSNAASFDLEQDTSGWAGDKVFRVLGRSLGVDGERVLLVSLEDVTLRRRAERLLRHENTELTGQMESTVQQLDRTQDELHLLASRLITAQDEERRRIARELHDDLTQRLALLEIGLDQLLLASPEEGHNRVRELQKQVADLSEETRHVAHRLHPSALDDLGLDAVLRTLVEEFAEREHMIATFYTQGMPDTLPPDVSASLYRITQEALRNITKHAGRTHVKVMLVGSDGDVRLTIRDFGDGFDFEAARSRSLGLISMEERAKLIGGTLTIHSSLGEGTTVSVCVPLAEKA